jgi:hypothetical protein
MPLCLYLDVNGLFFRGAVRLGVFPLAAFGWHTSLVHHYAVLNLSYLMFPALYDPRKLGLWATTVFGVALGIFRT